MLRFDRVLSLSVDGCSAGGCLRGVCLEGMCGVEVEGRVGEVCGLAVEIGVASCVWLGGSEMLRMLFLRWRPGVRDVCLGGGMTSGCAFWWSKKGMMWWHNNASAMFSQGKQKGKRGSNQQEG